MIITLLQYWLYCLFVRCCNVEWDSYWRKFSCTTKSTKGTGDKTFNDTVTSNYTQSRNTFSSDIETNSPNQLLILFCEGTSALKNQKKNASVIYLVSKTMTKTASQHEKALLSSSSA